MAFDKNLADRVRELLAGQSLIQTPLIEEKRMFGGLCFMVNNKMCICIGEHELMCRIGETQAEKELEQDNCRQVFMGGRRMKGYVDVDDMQLQSRAALDYWVQRCLQFNGEARVSKRKSSA